MKTKDYFDRSKLSHLKFIHRSKGRGSHARVPLEFLETIRDVNAMVVYVTLKSERPTHRWNTTTVYLKQKERGIKMGKGRVEKAMTLLKVEGWIRYVDFVRKDGRPGGTFVEVQAARLSEELRGGKGKIRENGDGSVSELTFMPPSSGKSKLTKPGRADAVAMNGKPAAQAREDVPKPRQPLPRPPGERPPGEEYKAYDIEERSPTLSGERGHEVPLGEGLGPDGPNANSQSVHVPPGAETATTDVPDDVTSVSAHVSTPGVEPVDFTRLVQLARLARENSLHAESYEAYLRDTVLPVLTNPSTSPLPRKWTQNAAVEWCNASVKGRIVLMLSVETEWPGDLARSFVKTPSKWPLSTIRLLLLARNFLDSRFALADLVRGDLNKKASDEESSLGYIQLFLENTRTLAGCMFREHKEKIKSFGCLGTLTQNDIEFRRQRWIQEILKFSMNRFPHEGPFQPSINNLRMTFEWFLLATSPFNDRIPLHDGHKIGDVYFQFLEEHRSSLSRFVAANGLAYRILLSQTERELEALWGLTAPVLSALRVDAAKRLNSIAELYEIEDRVQNEDILWAGGINDLAETPKAGFPQLSPDGKSFS